VANVHELKKRGYTAFQEGRIQDALTQYIAATRKSPKDDEAWNMLAVLHGMTGNLDDAEICCQRALQLRPHAAPTYNNLGLILKQKGRIPESIDCFRRSLEASPTHAPTLNNLASVLREAGAKNEALSLYQKAITFNPDYAEAHSNLGALLQEIGRIQEALQSYQRAVRLEPSDIRWLMNFGCGLREAGRMEESARVFQRVLQLAPQNALAWDGLSHAQLELRRYAEAGASGLHAIELDPGLSPAYLHAGAAFQAAGHTEQAVDLFRRLLTIDPTNESAHYFLAIASGESVPDKSPAEYVRDLFDGYAETFDDSLVKKLEYRTPTLLAGFAGELLGNDGKKIDIIDLGCGTGLCGPLFRPFAHRLVGVDLAPKMIAKAQERGVYDELLVDDLIPPLLASPGGFDLVLAADVFVYLGALDQVFDATKTALRHDGLFMFSTEKEESTAEFVLRSSGRYAHARTYVRDLAATLGFAILSIEDVVLRKESGNDIQGNIYVLRRD